MGRSGYETSGLWAVDDSETPDSIYSADTPEIEEDHPLFQLKDTFLQVVMAAYMQVNARKPDGKGPQVIEGTNTSFELPDRECDTSSRPRKRGRFSDSTPSTAEEKQSRGVPTKRRAQDRRLWLACPYAKKDPVQYRDCYRYFLARVRDVKQHLNRCHRRPIYCPICKETFEDEDARDCHIVTKGCSARPSIVVQGISETQKKELNQRVSSKMPEEQQWFTVFDIIFSPHPRPRTPYRDRELSEDLCVFQDFMTARGPALLADFLENRGVVTSSLPREERDLATFKEDILGEGLQLIIEQWTNDSARAIDRDSVPHSPQVSQTIDSGIAMQVDYPQTERSKTDDGPSGNHTGSSVGDERHDEKREQTLENDSNQMGNQEPGEGILRLYDGSTYNSPFRADTKIPLEYASIDPGQNDLPEVPDPGVMSQFTVVPDCSESTVFLSANGLPDMFSFDTDWFT
ncbi:hypothetical protein AAE478_010248 [Parahypoxylon ruwenzoriense]